MSSGLLDVAELRPLKNDTSIDSSFDNLVLPHGHKQLLTTLVHRHFISSKQEGVSDFERMNASITGVGKCFDDKHQVQYLIIRETGNNIDLSKIIAKR